MAAGVSCLLALGGRVSCPWLYEAASFRLIMEYLPLPTILEVLELQESDDFGETLWMLLAEWALRRHACCNMIPGDGNLSNFLWDASEGQVIGLDFEEYRTRSPAEADAILAGYLLEYTPQRTMQESSGSPGITESFAGNRRADQHCAGHALSAAHKREVGRDRMRIGAVVLCGGKSSRMGPPKPFLTIEGETFLQRILSQLQDFDEILLSVNGFEQWGPPQYRTVIDQEPNCGPMGGLHAALSACDSDALLAVSRDIPLFCAELSDILREAMESNVGAVIPVTPDGWCHPLCTVYHKALWPVFQTCLQSGKYKLLDALRQMHVRYIPVVGPLAACLKNVNTLEDYAYLFKTKSGSG